VTSDMEFRFHISSVTITSNADLLSALPRFKQFVIKSTATFSEYQRSCTKQPVD